MNSPVEIITLSRLALSFFPVLLVLGILYRWSAGGGTGLYAIFRMVAQLFLVGYVLTFIFESTETWVVGGTLSIMLIAASWIALRPIQKRRATTYFEVLISLLVGGITTLVLVTRGVLGIEGWHEASVYIPIAGMLFSNSMNTVSLAAERYESEMVQGVQYYEARKVALRTALIPLINTLFAVGLVAFPGMMTGQILSGVEPLVAVRYQIMVMSMLFGSGGLCAAFYLLMQKRHTGKTRIGSEGST
jgi:putative ABC transport system permease protein